MTSTPKSTQSNGVQASPLTPPILPLNSSFNSSSSNLKSPSFSRTPGKDTPKAPTRTESFSENLLKKALSLASGKEISGGTKKDPVQDLTEQVETWRQKCELLINEFQGFKKDVDSKVSRLEETKKSNEGQIAKLTQEMKDLIMQRDATLSKMKLDHTGEVNRLDSKYDALSQNYVFLRKSTKEEIERLNFEKKEALDRALESENMRLKNIADELAERERLSKIYEDEKTELLRQISVLTEERDESLENARVLLHKLNNLNTDYQELDRKTTEEIAGLRDQLRKSGEDNADLRRIIDEKEAYRVELDGIIADRNNFILDLESKIQKNLADLAEAAHQIKVLEKEKSDALKLAADNDKLYKQNVEYEQLVRDRLIKGHESERISLLADVEQLSDTKTDLTYKLKITTENLERTTLEYYEARARNEREQNTLRQEMSRLKEEKSSDKATFDELERGLAAQILKLEKELADTIDRYETQLAKLNKEFKELKEKSTKQIDELQSSNHSLTEENFDVKVKLEAVTNESKLCLIDLSKTRKENELLIKSKESLQESLTTLEREESKLHSTFEDTKASLEQTIQKLNNSENEITRMKKENKDLIDSDSRSQKLSKEAARELEFANEKIKKLDVDYATLAKESETLKSQVENLKNTNSKVTKKIKELELTKKSTETLLQDNNMGDYMGKFDEVKAELTKMHKTEIDGLKNEIKKLQTEKKENDDELDDLNNKLLSLAKVRKTLEDTIVDLKSTHENKMKQVLGEKQKLQNDLLIISSDKNFLEEKERLESELNNVRGVYEQKIKDLEVQIADLAKKEAAAVDNFNRNVLEEQVEREKLIKSFVSERKQVVEELDRLREEKKQFDSKERHFMESGKEYKKTLDGLKQQVERLSGELKGVSGERLKMTEQLKTSETRGPEFDKLKAQVTKLNDDLRKLETDKTKYAKAYFFEKNLKDQAINALKKKDPNSSFVKKEPNRSSIDLNRSLNSSMVIELPSQNEEELLIKTRELEDDKQQLLNKITSLTETLIKKSSDIDTLKFEADNLQKDIEFYKSQEERHDQILASNPTDREVLILKNHKESEERMLARIIELEKNAEAFVEERKKFSLIGLQIVDLKQHNIERALLDNAILFIEKPEYANKIPVCVKSIYLSMINFGAFDSKKNQSFCDNILKSYEFILADHFKNIPMMTYWLNSLYRLFTLVKSDYPAYIGKVLADVVDKKFDLKDFKPVVVTPQFTVGRSSSKLMSLEEVVAKFGMSLYHLVARSYLFLFVSIFEKIDAEIQAHLFTDNKMHEQPMYGQILPLIKALDVYYNQMENQKIDDAVMSHFFKTIARHIDEYVFNTLSTRKVSSERGLKVKMGISSIENWFDSKSIEVSFPFSRQTSDVLLIDDKNKLLDQALRKEIVPVLSPAQLSILIKNFEPEKDLPWQLISQIGNETNGNPIQLDSKIVLDKSIIEQGNKKLLFEMDFPQTKSQFPSIKVSESLSSRKELSFLSQ